MSAEPSLLERTVAALRMRLPMACIQGHVTDSGATLLIEFIENNGSRHFYSTPPGQDYRQHDVPWLVHRFHSMMLPAYAGAQLRGTLEAARLEAPRGT